MVPNFNSSLPFPMRIVLPVLSASDQKIFGVMSERTLHARA
jgi:hypothetical protein